LTLDLFQIISRIETLRAVTTFCRKALPPLSVAVAVIYFFLVPLSGAIDRGRTLDADFKNEKLKAYSERKGIIYADVKDPEFIAIIASDMDDRAIEAQREFFNSKSLPLLVLVGFVFLIFKFHMAVAIFLVLVFFLAAIRISSGYSVFLSFSPVVFWLTGGLLRKTLGHKRDNQ